MKDQDEIFQQIKDILVEMFDINEEDIALNSNLYEDLDIDSIDAVDLIVKLRDITGKKVAPEDFKSVRTVQDIVDAIEKLVSDT